MSDHDWIVCAHDAITAELGGTLVEAEVNTEAEAMVLARALDAAEGVVEVWVVPPQGGIHWESGEQEDA